MTPGAIIAMLALVIGLLVLEALDRGFRRRHLSQGEAISETQQLAHDIQQRKAVARAHDRLKALEALQRAEVEEMLAKHLGDAR